MPSTSLGCEFSCRAGRFTAFDNPRRSCRCLSQALDVAEKLLELVPTRNRWGYQVAGLLRPPQSQADAAQGSSRRTATVNLRCQCATG